jgi:3-hydroxyisobutyrate dehydrogenase
LFSALYFLPACGDTPMMAPLTEAQGGPMRIGFIGTGTMGTPIAGCLVAAGHQLTVYDIRHEATLTLQQHGAAIADTPRAVAQASEAVFTSLPGPSQVEAAALDPQTGLIAGLPGGGAYIDLTTNAPGTIRRLAAACQQRGIDFLDAPVSGRPPTMTVMAGGDATVFARCRPLLEAIAKNVFHVGPNGAGCVAKLVTQYLGYTNFMPRSKACWSPPRPGSISAFWRRSCRSAPARAAPSTISRVRC